MSWVSGVHGTKVARSRKCVTSLDSRSGDHSEETLFFLHFDVCVDVDVDLMASGV